MLLGMMLMGCQGAGDWEPLVSLRGVHYLDVSVDGTWTSCLVDTGATTTVVRSDLVAGDHAVLGFAGIDREAYVAAHPDYGDPLLEQLSDGADMDVGCILSWDTLSKETAFTIDYAEQRIRFDRRGRRAARMDEEDLGEPVTVPMLYTGDIPMAEATLGGVDLLVAVDTGASTAHLQPAAFDALDPQPETSAARVSTADGVVNGDYGLLDRVVLGEVTEREVDFVTFDSLQMQVIAESGYPDLEGLIGASLLTRFVVTFDRQKSELVLQPYSDAVADELVETLRDEMVGGGLQLDRPQRP